MNEPASGRGLFLGLREAQVQRSGGMGQPRVRRRQSDLHVGLGQSNVNSPGRFQRAVAFHIAGDEIPQQRIDGCVEIHILH